MVVRFLKVSCFHLSPQQKHRETRCTAELAALDVQVAHYRIDTGFAQTDETSTKGGQMWPVATPPLSSDSLAAALQPSPVGSVGQGTMVGGQLSLTRSHDFDLDQSDLEQDGLDDWLGAQHARHATAKMAALGRDCAESLAARLTELNLEQLATLRVVSTRVGVASGGAVASSGDAELHRVLQLLGGGHALQLRIVRQRLEGWLDQR